MILRKLVFFTLHKPNSTQSRGFVMAPATLILPKEFTMTDAEKVNVQLAIVSSQIPNTLRSNTRPEQKLSTPSMPNLVAQRSSQQRKFRRAPRRMLTSTTRPHRSKLRTVSLRLVMVLLTSETSRSDPAYVNVAPTKNRLSQCTSPQPLHILPLS